MSTGSPGATLVPLRPANRPAVLEVRRADRSRWAQHLGQIAIYYPLARPRILGGDSISALALKSRAPLPCATPVSEPHSRRGTQRRVACQRPLHNECPAPSEGHLHEPRKAGRTDRRS